MNDLLEGFDSAYDETMRHEGGYANDPHDKEEKHTAESPGDGTQVGRAGE